MFSITRIVSAQSASATVARSFHASAAAAGEVQRGVCKWFNNQKGYGFIAPDNGSEDVFVHHSNIKAMGFKSLMDGEPVEYEVETDSRTGKITATNVTGPDGVPVKGRPRPPMSPNMRREPRMERRYD